MTYTKKIRTMTVAFQRMFGILERWNNNQVTPSLSKPHELSYRSNSFNIYARYRPLPRPIFLPRDPALTRVSSLVCQANAMSNKGAHSADNGTGVSRRLTACSQASMRGIDLYQVASSCEEIQL